MNKRQELKDWLVSNGIKDPKDPLTFIETRFWQKVKDISEVPYGEDPDFGDYEEEMAYGAFQLLKDLSNG